MAFGPEGDPIPPAAFIATAARQPEAEIPVGRPHGSVRASRVAAVFDAQGRGPLTSAQGDPVGGECLIMAMLGLGPQQAVASEAELRGERRGGELTAFGRELMISHAVGSLLPDCRSRAGASHGDRGGLSLADGQAIRGRSGCAPARPAPAELKPPTTAGDRSGAELALPDCTVREAGDALLLRLPSIGAVRLANLGNAAEAAPRVSIFRANGEPAGIPELVAELGRASPESRSRRRSVGRWLNIAAAVEAGSGNRRDRSSRSGGGGAGAAADPPARRQPARRGANRARGDRRGAPGRSSLGRHRQRGRQLDAEPAGSGRT